MPTEQPETFKMRLDAVSAYQLDALTRRLGLPRTTVMKLALRAFAEAHNIDVLDVGEPKKAAA